MTRESTTTLQVGGLHWATSESVIGNVLGRRPGVLSVQANAVGQTATVTYDPERTSVAELAGWVRDCGYHCSGRSVPDHVCDPMTEPDHAAGHPGDHGDHGAAHTSHEAMGHGGHHAGMSMDDMVRDMRNRFLVAALLSIPILLWSPIGREVLGFTAPAPFGLRDDVFSR